jgi:hypothetical protein
VTEPGGDPTRALTVQLVEWLVRQPRSYGEVIDAWKTTCPRLSIWEDACIDGLVDCDKGPGRIVTPSADQLALLGKA